MELVTSSPVAIGLQDHGFAGKKRFDLGNIGFEQLGKLRLDLCQMMAGHDFSTKYHVKELI